ncbi:class I poly(R)-hydroxyalkanoic acid synthase [Burkholderia sp. GS2Y]|uniref:Class I poly(R)-hydroxyalkanoic acid synthase n=1 Tax=Burkholderia theae TaxID=3143496 RepID=A0ABU9WJD3_9BURK
MANPFNVPDEFIKGFMESARNYQQALAQSLTAPPSLQFRATPALQVGEGVAGALMQLQLDYVQRQVALWSGAAAAEGKVPELMAPSRGDRRFSAAQWRDDRWYSLLKQSYLLNAKLVDEIVEAAELDDASKKRLRFYTRQFIDAMSPTNYFATNPEVQKLAVDTRGESLKAGLANLIEDLKRGRVSITDESAFEVGKNVATSEGSVVFENELFQLIQYAPLTGQVARRPLVIVPPAINKFYILDLQPENSFVRFASNQGYTVFLVSWCNPGPELGNVTWDDYVEKGAMKAIEVGRAIGGADKVNVVGWCVGGTILSSALAVMRARGDETVESLTLLTTMLDFGDPGELGVFVDEQSVTHREQTIGRGGIYPGSELGFVFQTLRANDLLWQYVVSNYLKGSKPPAFDLLYWNADSTNLPGPMYAYYIRNMYHENNLRVPGRLTMCGTTVDLGKIDMPSYVLATQEDHIVPWRSAYCTTQMVGGESQFVLGASGHIAGVINPASTNKRSFWTDGEQGADPQAWLDSAKSHPGSWWTHWANWLKPHGGELVDAPTRPGNRKYKPIEPAPGRYVRVRTA